MSRKTTIRPQARRDLADAADYIARDNVDAARRFLEAAEAAFELLAAMPQMGTQCTFRSPAAAGLRTWSIRGFRNYVVFYRPFEDGVDVVRVIHGARDIEAIFEEPSR
jgi:toxin ParE1/3/4